MKAMVLAAGLGTRLYPITKNTPKAMVDINGKPLIHHIINKLIRYNFTDIIVNVHHFADQIISYIDSHDFGNARIVISDEREQLLDTGGGLMKASWFLKDGPFLIHNVDILSEIDLQKMAEYHQENKGLATLAIQKRESSRALLFDNSNILSGWTNKEKKITRTVRNADKVFDFGFSGIHIVNPEIFQLIEEQGVFSIMTPYIRLAKNYDFYGFRHDNDWWSDVGTHEKLQEARDYIKRSY
jgi:NDP-sugar pyrophosphorylase family protein